MPLITRSALVSFSAAQMYDLVNDVARYPDFLPGCCGSAIIEHNHEMMLASVSIAKAGISKTFTTRNQLVEKREIIMSLVDGPFKHLQGGWFFTPLDECACKVELKLEFEFSSKVVEIAFGKIFHQLTSNMVDAFTQRAKRVY